MCFHFSDITFFILMDLVSCDRAIKTEDYRIEFKPEIWCVELILGMENILEKGCGNETQSEDRHTQ
jgi:hypothetical protein